MKKKIIAMLLVLAMLVALVPAAMAAEGDTPAEGNASTASVNFTAQAEGAFLIAPQFGVEVAGNLAESYGYTDSIENGVSALDVLVKAHELMFGEDFTKETASTYLAVASSGWITTIFGEENSSAGFILNGAFAHDGTSSDYGYTGTTINTQAVVDEDTVEFFIYMDKEMYLDNIAWFTKDGKVIEELTIKSGEKVSIGVMGLSYMWYGGNFKDAEEMHGSTFAKAMEYAQFAWVNIASGELTDIDGAIAGEDGTAEITAPGTEGTYYLTAYITAEDIEDGVIPIVMSLLKVEVTPPTATDVMHNIAAKYAESGIVNDANAPWLAADMAAYAMAFPDTENRLSDEQVQEYLDKLIGLAVKATSPGDLAKYIIALRALGFDARKVVTAELEEVDVVKKLTDMIEPEHASYKSMTNQYTLPYVIIALQQGKDYATKEQMDILIQAAVDSKDSWKNTSWGTDGATPMILALSEYYKSNAAVKAAVDEAIEAVKGAQNAATGELNKSNTAASTGLGMAAFAALNMDSVTESGKTLADGLMVQVSDTFNGFKPTSSTFATEQGFRGLVAMANKGKSVFDFDEFPMRTAEATWAVNCPVEFAVIPDGADIEVKLGEEVQAAKASGKYDLAAGEYTYTVSKSGYTSKSGGFEVKAEDMANHTKKNIKVSLASTPPVGSDKINVNIKVLNHDSAVCGGKYTYKRNKSAYTVVLADKKLSMDKGQSVFDALDMTGVEYSERSFGYIDSIGGDSEFGHGSEKSGWLYMVNGEVVDIGCRDYKLTADTEIIWFYTDDYTVEHGSENVSSGGGGGGTSSSSGNKKEEEKKDEDTATAFMLPFKDVENHWSIDAINYVYEKGLMDGMSEKSFKPDTSVSRAMIVTILYRLAGEPEVDGENPFDDVAADTWYEKAVIWGVKAGVIDGMSEMRFDPNGEVSREQIAVMFYRYAGSPDVADTQLEYSDADTVSDWANSAVRWAVDRGIINGRSSSRIVPAGKATRAEAATIIMRYATAE